MLLQRMWQLENSLNGYVDLTNRLFDTVEQSQANAEDYKRLWKAEAYSFEVAAAEASVMIDQLQSQIADPQNLIETAHTCLNPGAARKVSLPALGMHCWCGFRSGISTSICSPTSLLSRSVSLCIYSLSVFLHAKVCCCWVLHDTSGNLPNPSQCIHVSYCLLLTSAQPL